MNSPRVSLFRRRLGTAAVVLGGLAFLHFSSNGGLPGLAADLRNCQAQNAELAERRHDTEELDERLAVAAVRTEYRLGVLDRLVAGRTTLRAACNDYRRFVGPDERFDRLLLAVSAGADEGERVANYLLTSLVKGRPVDAATRARLAAEFRSTFGPPPEFLLPHDGPFSHGSASAGAAPLFLAPESAHCP